MFNYREERRKAQKVIDYHAAIRCDLIALAWRMVEDRLDDTQSYRHTVAEIMRHERIIAAFQREYGLGTS